MPISQTPISQLPISALPLMEVWPQDRAALGACYVQQHDDWWFYDQKKRPPLSPITPSNAIVKSPDQQVNREDRDHTAWYQPQARLSQPTTPQKPAIQTRNLDKDLEFSYWTPRQVPFQKTSNSFESSQRMEPLPELDRIPWTPRQVPIPNTANNYEPSQRAEPLPIWDSIWWEQVKHISYTVSLFGYPTPSQRQDPLLDFSLQWWEQPKPLPQSQPGSIGFPQQRFDPLFILDSWWEQFKQIPDYGSSLQPQYNPPPSQRFDSLPNFSFVEWTPREMPISLTENSFEPSQRFDSIPVQDMWWRAIYEVPTVANVFFQLSQRIDPLPELDFWQRIPRLDLEIQPPVVDFPQQRFDELPVWDSVWWEVLRTVNGVPPVPQYFIPPPASQRYDSIDPPPWWMIPPRVTFGIQPTFVQPDQRYDDPIPLNYVWWEQYRIPALFYRITSKQLGCYRIFNSVTSDQLGSYGISSTAPILVSQWGSYKVANSILESQRGSYGLIVAHILSKQLGEYYLYNSFTDEQLGTYTYAKTLLVSQRGSYHIRGTVYDSQRGVYGIRDLRFTHRVGDYRVKGIPGFNIYVGYGSLPDLTLAPTQFSISLPIYVSHPPPISGQQTIYVVVREKDSFGLESQNQQPLTVIIDLNGNTILPDLPIPLGVAAAPEKNSAIRVMARYPAFSQEQHPADVWRIWINTVPPDPLVDIPTATKNVNGANLSEDVLSYAAGTYYIAVALYRTADGKQSLAGTTIVVVPLIPDEPDPVHSGAQIPHNI